MQDPDPPEQQPAPTGWAKWKPHQSVVGGNTVGGAVAVLILPFVLRFYPAGVDHDNITVALSALCTFVACYIIPDSSNR